MRQVHLVQDQEEQAVLELRCRCGIEPLGEGLFVELLFEGVVVTQQILVVAPSGLNRDYAATGIDIRLASVGIVANDRGERLGKLCLARSANTLQ